MEPLNKLELEINLHECLEVQPVLPSVEESIDKMLERKKNKTFLAFTLKMLAKTDLCFRADARGDVSGWVSDIRKTMWKGIFIGDITRNKCALKIVLPAEVNKLVVSKGDQPRAFVLHIDPHQFLCKELYEYLHNSTGIPQHRFIIKCKAGRPIGTEFRNSSFSSWYRSPCSLKHVVLKVQLLKEQCFVTNAYVFNYDTNPFQKKVKAPFKHLRLESTVENV